MYQTNKLNKNVDVLLFVEHKDRELEITCEMANILEKQYKLNIAIASLIFEPMSSIFQLNPKVVVTPSTAFGHGSAAWIYYEVFGENISFVNMNYEQFISSWKGKYKTPSHYISKNKQKHFTWGEYFGKTLIESGISKENIFLTGRPLSTIIKKKYIGQQLQHREEISKKLNIDSNKIWNFIALTDGLAFVGEEKIQFIAKSGGKEDELRDHISYVKETIKVMIHWLDDYIKSSQMDNYYFILRPHPSIANEQYEKLFIDILGYIPKNILLSKDFSAYKWLEASDRYFTNYSTLAIDAEILEKKYFVFNPILKNVKENYWWCESGEKLNTYNEFRTICETIPELNYKYETHNNHFINFTLDGIEQSTKFINEFVQGHRDYPQASFLQKFKPFLLNSRRTFGSLVRFFLVSNNINILNLVRKGNIVDYFTEEEIINLKGKNASK